MKITTEPRSDQWNADDFVGGPRTFTIAGVKVGVAEQKYDIDLIEGDGRVWRPPLTMLRLLVAAWTDDSTTWVGRRVTLFRDASIRFGKDQVGGIRISHMSDLPEGKRFDVMVQTSRGRRERVSADPLPDAPAPLADSAIACADREQIKAWWNEYPQQRAALNARADEIKAADEVGAAGAEGEGAS